MALLSLVLCILQYGVRLDIFETPFEPLVPEALLRVESIVRVDGHHPGDQVAAGAAEFVEI
jgi:hypothetical protein